MVLVFGMTVVGCDNDPTDDGDETANDVSVSGIISDSRFNDEFTAFNARPSGGFEYDTWVFDGTNKATRKREIIGSTTTNEYEIKLKNNNFLCRIWDSSNVRVWSDLGIYSFDDSGNLLLNDITYRILIVPYVPTAVSISVSETFSNRITVTWNSGRSANGYKVYRSLSSSGTYNIVGSPTSNSFVDIGLSADTTYYYKVSAFNNKGESSQSESVSATTRPPKSITISGIPSNFNGNSFYLRLFSRWSNQMADAYGNGNISNNSVTIVLMDNGEQWTGAGSYHIHLVPAMGYGSYAYTNGLTWQQLNLFNIFNGALWDQRLPKYNISTNSTNMVINFSQFRSELDAFN